MAEGDLLQAQIKAYVALVACLHKKGVITPSDLDSILVQVAKRTPAGHGQDYLNALIEEVRRASEAVVQLAPRDQREPH